MCARRFQFSFQIHEFFHSNGNFSILTHARHYIIQRRSRKLFQFSPFVFSFVGILPQIVMFGLDFVWYLNLRRNYLLKNDSKEHATIFVVCVFLLFVHVFLTLSTYSYWCLCILIVVYVFLLFDHLFLTLSMYSYCCLCILIVVYVFLFFVHLFLTLSMYSYYSSMYS